MNLLERYLGRVVLFATLMVLTVLLGIEVFFTLVDEFGDVGKGAYGFADAIAYVALTLPRRAYTMLPVAALLGTVVGLGVLASHGELVVLRAAGLSVLRIALGVLKTGALIALGGLLIGETLAPPLEHYAQAQRTQAQTNRVTLQTEEGFWAKDGTTFIHIQDIRPGAALAGVTIYEFGSDNRLRVAGYAKGARYREGHWVLEGLQQSLIEDGRVSTVEVKEALWETIISPELLSVAIVQAENLSALGLYRYVDYLKSNGLDYTRYELAFWQRLAKPLATLVMVLLAVPFTFGPMRSTHTGARLLAGAVVGFGFHLFNLVAGQMSLVYGLWPAVGATLPSLLGLTLALLWIRRIT